MNPQWFGDSYDIVKRFFVTILKDMGYTVYVDPMFTGDWGGSEESFYDFVGVSHLPKGLNSENSALLLDPDTGVRERSSRKHASIDLLVESLRNHRVVFAFDQSFSRGHSAADQMRRKLELLKIREVSGFYYDSHARFLFSTKEKDELNAMKNRLIASGLPRLRIFEL